MVQGHTSRLPPNLRTNQNIRFASSVTAVTFIFTLNNPDRSQDLFFNLRPIQYCVYQLEVGASDTPHFQGYLRLVKKSKIGTAKNLFRDNRVQIEACRSQAASMNYATKLETRVDGPWEIGKKPIIRNLSANMDGQKSDVDFLNEKILHEKMSYLNLYKQYPELCRAHQHYIDRAYSKKSKMCRRDFKDNYTGETLITYFMTGPTCTGKTSLAKTMASVFGYDVYVKVPGKYWPGYMGQKAVIFDGLVPGRVDISHLKSIINFDISHVSIKNGFAILDVKVIFLISNCSFEELFFRVPFRIKQTLQRRLTAESVFSVDESNNCISVLSLERDPANSSCTVIGEAKTRYSIGDLRANFGSDICKELLSQ